MWHIRCGEAPDSGGPSQTLVRKVQETRGCVLAAFVRSVINANDGHITNVALVSVGFYRDFYLLLSEIFVVDLFGSTFSLVSDIELLDLEICSNTFVTNRPDDSTTCRNRHLQRDVWL